jgi:hypothetical protein
MFVDPWEILIICVLNCVVFVVCGIWWWQFWWQSKNNVWHLRWLPFKRDASLGCQSKQQVLVQSICTHMYLVPCSCAFSYMLVALEPNIKRFIARQDPLEFLISNTWIKFTGPSKSHLKYIVSVPSLMMSDSWLWVRPHPCVSYENVPLSCKMQAVFSVTLVIGKVRERYWDNPIINYNNTPVWQRFNNYNKL